MPRTVYPEGYPVKYHEIAERCGRGGAVIRLPREGKFPDDGGLTGLERLLKLRAHFYAFIGAVKKSNDPKWQEMKTWVSQTSIYLDKEKVCLIFSNRDQSWQSKAFDSAGQLDGEEAVSAIPSGVDESLARVLAGINKDIEKGDL